MTVAELSCGRPLAEALQSLRARVPGSEVADPLRRRSSALAAYGSPLADQLRRQSSALRRDQRRAVEERRRPRRAEDPARRRPGPRPLGPADDRRRPDRQRRHLLLELQVARPRDLKLKQPDPMSVLDRPPLPRVARWRGSPIAQGAARRPSTWGRAAATGPAGKDVVQMDLHWVVVLQSGGKWGTVAAS